MPGVRRKNYPIIDGGDYKGDYSEIDKAMISFIKTYGTHYAKSTIMGIGVDFETRYTEKETLDKSKRKREDCSTISGGAQLFGLSTSAKNTECTDTLKDTTQGENTRLQRFISNTYGTLPVSSPAARCDSEGMFLEWLNRKKTFQYLASFSMST